MLITKISQQAINTMSNCELRLCSVIFLVSVSLLSPGSAFKLYDLLNDNKNTDALGSDRANHADSSLLTRTERCLKENCEHLEELPGYSEGLQASCVLDCLTAAKASSSSSASASSPDSTDRLGYDLRDREVDVMSSCAEAMCANFHNSEAYWSCAIANCVHYGSYRRSAAEPQDINHVTQPQDINHELKRLFSGLAGLKNTSLKRGGGGGGGKNFARRQAGKRPADLCTQCYPNDPVGHYPECRNMCG